MILWSIFYGVSERLRPDSFERIDRRFDCNAAIVLDAEIASRDVSDFARRDTPLCRNCVHASKRSGRNGYDRARAAFAEERILGGTFSAGIGAFALKLTSAESPSLAKQDSASVRRVPPSLTSCAERDRFFAGELHEAIDQPLLCG